MDKGTEVIRTEQEQDTLPAIMDTALVALAEQAEKRVEAMNKIKRMALKLTNRHDWVDENGKPYLQASGGEKVARLFGISWRISEPLIENLEGGHWLVTYTGEFSLGGVPIDAVGTRSSKDPFFKKYRYEGPEADRKKIELPPSEIDRGDVKKAAFSNLLANGITRLLGIRNLTYDELLEYAGIRREDITSVTFKKGGKPQAQQAGKPGTTETRYPSHPDEPITEAQQRAIHAVLKERLDITDELAKAQKVAQVLGLKDPPTSMSKLTKGQASKVIEKLQQEAAAGTQAPQEGEA